MHPHRGWLLLVTMLAQVWRAARATKLRLNCRPEKLQSEGNANKFECIKKIEDTSKIIMKLGNSIVIQFR
jgi:hypothetical protein